MLIAHCSSPWHIHFFVATFILTMLRSFNFICLFFFLFFFTRQVSGVVMDPYRGARSEGVGGFFRGVKSGVTGAAVKPLVAVLDAATFGFEQVADQIGNLGEVPVRHFF